MYWTDLQYPQKSHLDNTDWEKKNKLRKHNKISGWLWTNIGAEWVIPIAVQSNFNQRFHEEKFGLVQATAYYRLQSTTIRRTCTLHIKFEDNIGRAAWHIQPPTTSGEVGLPTEHRVQRQSWLSAADRACASRGGQGDTGPRDWGTPQQGSGERQARPGWQPKISPSGPEEITASGQCGRGFATTCWTNAAWEVEKQTEQGKGGCISVKSGREERTGGIPERHSKSKDNPSAIQNHRTSKKDLENDDGSKLTAPHYIMYNSHRKKLVSQSDAFIRRLDTRTKK